MTEIKSCPYKNICYKNKVNKCNDDDIFCMKLYKLDQLSSLALLTDSQRKFIPLRLDKDEGDKESFLTLKNIENNISEFVNSGSNLYIYSNLSGNGKTSWSLRLLNKWLDSIWHISDISCRALFIHVPRFLLSIKENISERNTYATFIKNNAFDADLVVWDELGSKGFTEFEMENVLSIINARISANKANIYTSNLNPDELKESVGQRLYSRIANQSTLVKLVGMDKRGLI